MNADEKAAKSHQVLVDKLAVACRLDPDLLAEEWPVNDGNRTRFVDAAVMTKSRMGKAA
jgi:hypothetical protein